MLSNLTKPIKKFGSILETVELEFHVFEQPFECSY